LKSSGHGSNAVSRDVTMSDMTKCTPTRSSVVRMNYIYVVYFQDEIT